MLKKVTTKYLGIIAILFLSALVRLYHFDRPLADWHSWRQADTASVTREYVKHGVNLLQPEYHDLSDIPSGKDNLEGYRMVEFPFINAGIAFTYPVFGFGWPIHIYSRMVNIAFSLAAIYLIYLIGTHATTQRIGLISALIYGLMPFNIFFHTTVLPEIPLVFFSLLTTYAWLRFIKSTTWVWWGLTVTSAALALLLKPIFVFYGLALLYAYWYVHGWKGLKNYQLYLAAVLSIIPLVLWRHWIGQFPQGIPASDWLFNSTQIRFKGAFFRWLFAQRIGNMMLGYWGLIPFGLGLVLKPHKQSGWFFHWWLVGMLVYLSVFATGNVTHDYYQIFIVPVIAIFTGVGIDKLVFEPLTQMHKQISQIVGIVSIGFMLAFGWFSIRDFFNINNPALVEAGAAVDRLTPAEALIIAPYMGDTAFLYQTNRRGWPIGFNIEDKISMGATYYISTSYDDEARWLEQACNLVEKNDQYILINLEACEFENSIDQEAS